MPTRKGYRGRTSNTVDIGGGMKKLAGRTLRSYMQATQGMANKIEKYLPEVDVKAPRRGRKKY